VFRAPLVRFVRFLSAHGRLGIVLQEEIRPLPVSQDLALSYDFKEIVVSRLKSFSQLLVCFLPIGGQAGLPSGNALAIPIANPPDFGTSPPIDNAVVLACSSPADESTSVFRLSKGDDAVLIFIGSPSDGRISSLRTAPDRDYDW
jgi:hypothetical protein